MKKQIIILILFSIKLHAQNPHFPVLNIPVPCTDEFINNYKGKWLIHDPALGPNSVTEYHVEVMKRINQIQNLVYQIYPQPMGSDASWIGGFSKTSFADEIKYELVRQDELQRQSIVKILAYSYSYSLVLCSWLCHGEKQIMNSYPEGGGAALEIESNRLTILNGNFPEGEEWTIDGRPIKQKLPAIGNWKGYEVMLTVPPEYADAASSHIVLISRDGMLPYIAVTRKQYLERAIPFVTRFYDALNKKIQENNDALPPQVRTSQEEIADQKTRNTKAKNNALSKLRDELNKTTKDGLLDAPAIIRPDALIEFERPVFLSEAQGGIMLATENPGYFRNDLPKYAAQFFVVEVSWSAPEWSSQFKKNIEENLPLEKLKAMIDK